MKLEMCYNCDGIKINEVTPYVEGASYCDCEEQKKVGKYVGNNEQIVSVYSEG
tara:strand:- start:256 stop:414 length:159 start_codon:yes stop_codon:yes gene_type:complete